MPLVTGKRALLEQLVADGVRYIFGNPGTTEQPFMDLLQDYPQLEFILCLHEGVAISLADAYARATRKPAFVELHIAPGLGNAVGMLFNAKVGQSPLVVYVGQSASRALFQEPLLSGDLVEIATPVTKWAYEINHAADLPQVVRRAFKVADEAPQGPVVLSIPIDVMDEEADVAIQPSSYTRWRAHPDPAAMDEAADLLARSRRPMIVTGDGVALSNGQDQAIRLGGTARGADLSRVHHRGQCRRGSPARRRHAAVHQRRGAGIHRAGARGTRCRAGARCPAVPIHLPAVGRPRAVGARR